MSLRANGTCFALLLAALAPACTRIAHAQGVAHSQPVSDAGPPTVSAFALADAGEPDASAPAAEFRGIVCLRTDASGARHVDLEYATCTDSLQCVAHSTGHTIDVHAFWWGQAFMLCTAANLGETRCRATTALPPDATSIRIDRNPQAIPIAHSVPDGGTSQCWRWPERTPTTSALHGS